MLSSHYRQPINWTVKGLEEAEKALGSFYDAASAEADPRPAPDVLEALCDDLNTPQAIAAVRGTRWAVDMSDAKCAVFVVNGKVAVRRRAGFLVAPLAELGLVEYQFKSFDAEAAQQGAGTLPRAVMRDRSGNAFCLVQRG